MDGQFLPTAASVAEVAYTAYTNDPTVECLISWFRAELRCDPPQADRHRQYDDDMLRRHTRQVEQLARQWRQLRCVTG